MASKTYTYNCGFLPRNWNLRKRRLEIINLLRCYIIYAQYTQKVSRQTRRHIITTYCEKLRKRWVGIQFTLLMTLQSIIGCIWKTPAAMEGIKLMFFLFKCLSITSLANNDLELLFFLQKFLNDVLTQVGFVKWVPR